MGGVILGGMRKPWGLVVFFCAWMLNPALLGGCSKILGPHFGEAEVVAVVNGANRPVPYRYEHGGKTYEISFQVAQVQGNDKVSALPGSSRGAALRQAHACGNRTFLRSAAACIDTTSVPVEGKLTVKRVGANPATLLSGAQARGELFVAGTELKHARLTLSAEGVSVRIAYENSSRAYTVESVTLPGS